MNNLNLWEKVRRKIKSSIKNNFTDIRKLIEYKQEEALAKMLGITRQTLSKFSVPVDAYSDKTSNTLLLSIIALMDQFLYVNRYDYDKILNYIKQLDKCFFSEVYSDTELVREIEQMDMFFLRLDNQKVQGRYISIWLRTVEYEAEELKATKNIEVKYREPTIRQVTRNFRIYVTSDFLLHKKAIEFFGNFIEIIMNRNNKIRISKFTIDIIQDSRISMDNIIYKNGIDALEIINALNNAAVLQRMESEPGCTDEIKLIINEISEKKLKNVIVFTQEFSDEILKLNCYGLEGLIDQISGYSNVFCLSLTGDEICFEKQKGYVIRNSLD